MRSVRDASQRLLIFQNELVGRYLRTEYRGIPRIFRMAQEIGLGRELETGGLDFLAQRAFLDAMQGFCNRRAVAGTRGMVGDDKKAAGFQRGKHLAVYLNATNLPVG